MKCLNKGADERYQSADDLLEALEELMNPSGSQTDPRPLAPRSPPSSMRSRRPRRSVVRSQKTSTMTSTPRRLPADSRRTRTSREANLGTFDEGGDLGETDFGDLDLSQEQDEEPLEMWSTRQSKCTAARSQLWACWSRSVSQRWFVFGGGDDGSVSGDGGPPPMSRAELSAVLNTGQVQGSLSAAEDMVGVASSGGAPCDRANVSVDGRRRAAGATRERESRRGSRSTRDPPAQGPKGGR